MLKRRGSEKAVRQCTIWHDRLILCNNICKFTNILQHNCSWTILTAINKDEFFKIPIPIIDFTKQREISELIEKSFALKKESEHLLEVAKRAVEIAIEENEEVALEFIENNSK